MKWIGRIFYIILVFYVITFLQGSGGAEGLANSGYATDNILHTNTVDENLSAISKLDNSYIEKQSSLLGTFNDTDYTLSYYRYGSLYNDTFTKKTGNKETLTRRYDGIYLYLDAKDEDGNYMKFDLTVNVRKGDYTTSTIIVDQYSGLFSSSGIYQITHLAHLVKPYVESTDRTFSWNEITSSDLEDFEITDIIFKNTENTYHFYTGDSTAYIHSISSENPIEVSKNLLSTSFEELPTSIDDINNQLYFVGKADLGKYFYWHVIVWTIYILLIVVIPFFLWVKKPLAAHLAHKKEVKARREKVEKVKNEKYGQYKTVQEAKIIEEEKKNTDSK